MGCLKIPYQEKKYESCLRIAYSSVQESEKKRSKYYPFGLVMSGISSKAANALDNKVKYNGMELQSKEFSDGMGLEMYEYKYRFYDHQIGRFISQDRLADKYVYYSPYQFAGNEVPNAIDLDGLEPLRINEGTKNLIIVAQGYGGNPPNGATQASNAAKTNPALAPDNALGSITSTGPSLQVGIFASSTSSNTKNDIVSTINDFRKVSPDGNVILIGHSQGADNIVELANENKDLKINLMITLDIKDASGKGIFSVDDDNIPSNVSNVINYYQTGEFIGGEKVDIMDKSKTKGANILSPGSNHRSIDNDLLPYIIQDVNNQLNGRDPVKNASERKLPQFDPKTSKSPKIS